MGTVSAGSVREYSGMGQAGGQLDIFVRQAAPKFAVLAMTHPLRSTGITPLQHSWTTP
jgi:hypothetical protein